MIDSHCHLADENVRRRPRPRSSRARRTRVSSARWSSSKAGDAQEAAQARALVERSGPRRASPIGVHPHAAHEFADDPRTRGRRRPRRRSDATPSARAVGEIGLDYHYDFSPRDVQQAVFRAQLRLARELELPVVIHTREADDDTLAILREEGGGELRGVLHCFTGSPRSRAPALDLGFYISLAGIVTFPKAGELRETAQARAARSAAGRNRQPVSGAGAAPRQAQRAGVRRARRRRRLPRLYGIDAADAGRAHRRANFHALFRP